MIQQPTVYLVDASIYIFRAWFSVPDTMCGDNGQPINAVYGFSRFLTSLLERSRASHIAIAFDESLSTSFRNEIYPAYKMNRELPPAELAAQFKYCRRVAEAAGIHCVSDQNYEADDLIATLALAMREQGFRSVIVTTDKDMAQVIREQDLYWNFAANQQLNYAQVKEKFGVSPEVMQDYLGLCGDAVDNIPGVPGIGPKTAGALLREFDDMDSLYCNLHQVPQLAIRGAKYLPGKLAEHEAQARLSRLLATVAYDAPIDGDATIVKRRCAEVSHFEQLMSIMGGRGEGLFQRMIESARQAR